jgi:hypothetical protein
LPSKHDNLSSNSSITTKKKKEEEEEDHEFKASLGQHSKTLSQFFF